MWFGFGDCCCVDWVGWVGIDDCLNEDRFVVCIWFGFVGLVVV